MLNIWHIIFIANIVCCTSVEISHAFRQEQQWWQAAWLSSRSVCHTLTKYTRCNIYCTGLLESARKQRRINNYKEAEQHTMQVLQQEPNNADAMSLLSVIHGDCGRSDKAKYFGQKAIEQDPRHAAAHCNLGRAYRISGQVQKALTHFKKSLEVGLFKTSNQFKYTVYNPWDHQQSNRVKGVYFVYRFLPCFTLHNKHTV